MDLKRAAAIVVFTVTSLGGAALLSVHAQEPASPSAAIAGGWRLNRELSGEPLSASAFAAGTAGTPGGNRGGGGGGASGGRGGRGGYGGGGGFGGGGNSGSTGGGRVSDDDQKKMRALMSEIERQPAHLAILVKDGQATFTDDTGAVHTFPISDKKTDVEFGSQKIETHTKWDGGALVQELKGGPLTVNRMVQTTTDGKQLVVTIHASGGGRGGAGQATKFIYDRE